MEPQKLQPDLDHATVGRPSSLRAEAAGMLAVTTFISTIQKFTNCSTGVLQVTFHADNKALITRRTDHDSHKTPFANQWSLPEADLIESIFAFQTEHKINATTLHVKGHQDANAKLEDLTTPEQMNVKADALANQCHSECPLSQFCATQI